MSYGASEAQSGRGLLLLTHPRVYPLQGDLVLIIARDTRLTLNTQTRESFPASEQVHPTSAPIFEYPGEVIVAVSCNSIGYGFRSFDLIYQLGRTGFFREDCDPMRQLRLIWNAATDLDSSDQFAWMNGHAELAGEGIVEAMEILLCMIGCNDSQASILSARALKALFRHVGHACFSQTALGLLSAGAKELRQAIENEHDADALAEMREALGEFEQRAFACPRL